MPRAAGADEINNRSIVSALAAVERNALQSRQARLAGADQLRRPFTRQVTETPTKLVNLWPASRIDEMMALAYPKAAPSAGNV